MASRTNRKETKQKRRRLRQTHRQNRLIPWVVGGGIVLMVAVPLTINYLRFLSLPGEYYRSQGNVHVTLGTQTPPYNSNPPTSGWHTAELAAWGSYDEPLPDQLVVHNMEDGGVLMWYRPGTPEDNAAHIAALESAARGYRRVVILPREDMPTQYALTAWTRLQRFDELDVEGKRAFLEAYEGIDHHPRGFVP
jgi:hypothetical protein